MFLPISAPKTLFRYSAIALLLIVGCQKPARTARAVYFGPTAVFALTDSTRELTPDETTTTFYQRRFNFHPTVNQPLHRIVSSRSTDKVYLGLVLPPVPPALADLAQTDSVWQLIERRELPRQAVIARFRSLRRPTEWNVRYLLTSKKSTNSHVINLLTTDSATAHRVYLADKPFNGQLLL